MNPTKFEEEQKIQLTQYSHGAGCGCKISPKVLDTILAGAGTKQVFEQLIVGYDSRDDAAVYDLGDGTGVISTTDFFMPIVDDPFTFGRIAATNAISDVYAMGGTPMMAVAILGWPINKLSPEVAGQVVAGGRFACNEAGIPLAGGHSIDCPEPIFGLAVTGRVPLTQLRKNGGALAGDLLYLTKPIGVGIFSTAQKKGLLDPAHLAWSINSMCTLNKVGAILGQLPYVHSLTDVTGFGLLGHLIEMCQASDTRASIDMRKVPTFDKQVLQDYIHQKCNPGGTERNWESYGHKVQLQNEADRWLLADPQTSGGLLVAVDPASRYDFEAHMLLQGFDIQAFGEMHNASADTQTHPIVSVG